MKKLCVLAILVLSTAVLPGITASAIQSPVRHEAVSQEPTISSRRGAIEIACPVNGRCYTFQIYAITGQLIKRIQLTDTATTIEIPQGCYIVKCESWVKKVIVH